VTVVAINQPCYLPWRGHFALLKAADVFVFYDDVQFTSNTSRSFFARVQLKTAQGRRWLTVPVRKSGRFGQRIDEVEVADDGRWRGQHGAAIREALRGAPFAGGVEPVVAALTGGSWLRLAELTIATTRLMAELLGIRRETPRSSALGIPGAGSDRVLSICRALGATRYVTGHGGLDYLEHETFAAAGVAVEYLDYDLSPYPQQHGAFEPYVTALDLIANIGPEAADHVKARAVPWREMLARRAAAPGGVR
jgi:WbqC-like protein family